MTLPGKKSMQPNKFAGLGKGRGKIRKIKRVEKDKGTEKKKRKSFREPICERRSEARP